MPRTVRRRASTSGRSFPLGRDRLSFGFSGPTLGQSRGPVGVVLLAIKNADAFPAFPFASANGQIRAGVGVAARAVRYGYLSRWGSLTTENVHAMRHWLQVIWIDAGGVTTEVIQLHPDGYLAASALKGEPVGSNKGGFLAVPSSGKPPVTLGFRGCPVPTAGRRVNANLGIKSVHHSQRTHGRNIPW